MKLDPIVKTVENIIKHGVEKTKSLSPTCRVGTAKQLGLRIEEFPKVAIKDKDIILRKFKGNIDEFILRKDMFKILGLDYKPPFEKMLTQQVGKFVSQETLEKIAQIYGLSVREVENARKAYYDSFASKYKNNLKVNIRKS